MFLQCNFFYQRFQLLLIKFDLNRYVPPNSVRIGTTMENMKGIKNIAFSTPDGGVVLIILNL